jgi:hypothetical protein
MTVESHSFYGLQAYDEATSFIVYEVYLDEAEKRPDFLQSMVSRLGAGQWEQLDDAQLIECAGVWPEVSAWNTLPVRVSHARSILPYRVHGGRELDLMRKGLKPLSVFSHVGVSSSEERFLSAHFAPLVESGMLVSAKFDHQDEDGKPATYMFALAKEAWRIEAYRLILATAGITNWNDTLELTEGTLLGYTAEQNEFWRAYRKRHGLRWGLQTFFRFLSDTEVEFVRKTGRKAFHFDDEIVRLYLPYEGDDLVDPVAIVRTVGSGALARFHAPMVKLRRLSRGVERHSNGEFEVFDIPVEEHARLNELIDGTIDLIES